MIEIRIEQRIERPADEVFDYVANFENNPRWQNGMESASFTSDGPLAIGSTYEQVARFLGREIRTSFEVVELAPRSVTIESRSGPLELRITRSVEPDGDGASTVTADVRGQPSGFSRLFQPLMRPLVRRSIRRDYRALKELLESE